MWLRLVSEKFPDGPEVPTEGPGGDDVLAGFECLDERTEGIVCGSALRTELRFARDRQGTLERVEAFAEQELRGGIEREACVEVLRVDRRVRRRRDVEYRERQRRVFFKQLKVGNAVLCKEWAG